LSQTNSLDQFLVCLCFFDWIQIFTLHVLGECDFEEISVSHISDNYGDLRDSGLLCGAPPSFTGNQLKPISPATNEYGLNNSVLLNRNC
jgi:hypothetical protein